MTDKEREAMDALMELVREQSYSIDGLENQLVIRTKERDGLARWQEKHVEAMSTNTVKMRRILGAQGGETPEDAARRVMAVSAEWESSVKRFHQERDSLASELYEERNNKIGRSPQDEELIRHLDFKIAETCNILGKRNLERLQDAARRTVEARNHLSEERDVVLRLLNDTQAASRQDVLWQQAQDRAEHFKAKWTHLDDIIGQIRDILGNPERLVDEVKRLVTECAEVRRPEDQRRIDFYDSILSDTSAILGRKNATEGLVDAAKRVVAKLGIQEAKNRELEQKRRDIVVAAGKVVTIYCPDTKDSDIDYQERFMDAMDELGGILDKEPSEDPGEVIKAEWVRCPEMDGDLQCVFEAGHDRTCGFGESLDDPELTRCSTRSLAGRQCLNALLHDGPHVFEGSELPEMGYVRCLYYSKGDLTRKLRCIREIDHHGNHVF